MGYNPELAMQQDDGVSWICWEDALGRLNVSRKVLVCPGRAGS